MEKFDREANDQSSSVAGNHSNLNSSQLSSSSSSTNIDHTLRTGLTNSNDTCEESSPTEGASVKLAPTEMLKESLKSSTKRTPVKNERTSEADDSRINRRDDTKADNDVDDEELDFLLSLENPVDVKGQGNPDEVQGHSTVACDDEAAEGEIREDSEKGLWPFLLF